MGVKEGGASSPPPATELNAILLLLPLKENLEDSFTGELAAPWVMEEKLKPPTDGVVKEKALLPPREGREEEEAGAMEPSGLGASPNRKPGWGGGVASTHTFITPWEEFRLAWLVVLATVANTCWTTWAAGAGTEELITVETGMGGPLSLKSCTFTTWGTVFRTDSVRAAPEAGF